MDFNDFVRENIEKYGEENCDLMNKKRIAAVTFKKNDKGNLAAQSRFGTVFVHTESIPFIKEGETWFCELQQHPHHRNIHHGRGIRKLDESFLLEITKDQMDSIVTAVWEKYRNEVERDLEAKYVGELDERAQKLADGKTDALNVRIGELEKELGDANVKISELESNASEEEYRLRCEDLEAQNQLLNERNDALLEEIADHKIRISELNGLLKTNNHRMPIQDVGSISDSIIRTDANTLYSSRFTDGRYKVRFSSDRSTIQIFADGDGEVRCSNNLLMLKGLNTVLPFDIPGEMSSSVEDDGRIIIDLA